jgi:signal transduction histidine kinase
MISKLIAMLEPQRRQLSLVMVLLLLTFVLTVALAGQARQAEAARQKQAQGILQDLAEGAAGAWASRSRQLTAMSVQWTFREAARTLLLDRDAPLAVLAREAAVPLYCEACASADAPPTFFSLDPADGAFEYIGPNPPGPAATRRLTELVRTGGYTLMHDSIGVAGYLLDDGARFDVATVYVRLGEDGLPVRAVGFFLPDSLFSQSLELVFGSLTLLPRTLTGGLPNDSFFTVRAVVGRAHVLGNATATDFIATDTTTTPPFAGLVLQVGIRENAYSKILMKSAATAGLPLLLTLLVVIAGLIVAALLLLRREAELVRLRADFISAVSHELRTPLAQIRMFAETLLLGRVRSDLERRTSLEIVHQEARRLTSIVENMLLFSKSQSGRGTRLTPEPISLADEVRAAVESFGPLSRSRDVEIRTELQEDIVVHLDRGALRQILLNLLDNALKYGPARQRITVGAALYDDTARVWVDDEGPGIPPHARERVFESFYRLPQEAMKRTAGSGIGLAVVRALAREHNGSVWVEAAPGGGARFVVQFPGAELRPPMVAAS